MEQVIYCKRMAETCGADDAPVMTSRALRNHSFAAIRLQIETPTHEKTDPLAIDESFIASVTIRGAYRRERWMDGRLMSNHAAAGSATSLMDLRRVNQARFLSPVDCIQFYFPATALQVVAEANELSLPAEMHSNLCVLFEDPVLQMLAASLVGAFERPDEASLLFVDHVLTAAAIHTIVRHFAAPTRADHRKGGLAPWQQRRVLELLDASLSGNISVQELADACSLSLRHFARAFVQTNGKSPYQWVIERRIERVKHLLSNSGMSIEEIATATSFAGQAHLTRSFKQAVGESPAAWRRARHNPTSGLG